jgi:hypothetical protein
MLLVEVDLCEQEKASDHLDLTMSTHVHDAQTSSHHPAPISLVLNSFIEIPHSQQIVFDSQPNLEGEFETTPSLTSGETSPFCDSDLDEDPDVLCALEKVIIINIKNHISFEKCLSLIIFSRAIFILISVVLYLVAKL